MLDFDKLAAKNILVIGDVILDKFYYGKVTRFTPDAPVPIIKTEKILNSPGGAGNVANNIASLGANATVIGFTGTDYHYHDIKQSLEKMDINALLIQTQNPTITKANIIGENADGETQKMFRLDTECTDYEETDYKQLISTIEENISTADAVIISDYQKGVCTTEVCKMIIHTCKENNIPVLVDPKGKDWRKYTGATLIKPNLKELSVISDKAITESPEDVVNFGKKVRSTYNLSHLVVSQSSQGVLCISENGHFNLAASATDVKDVIGAGDAMIATLGCCLAIQMNIREAAEIANHSSGIVVEKVGTVPIRKTDLELSAYKTNTKLIKDLDAFVSNIKDKYNKIVFTNGCFDIIHKGHLTHLKQARAYGDVLIIGLNSDASVKKLRGKNRPINTFEDRRDVLAGFEFVDFVVEFDDETPLELIKAIRPDVLVKGGNYTTDEVVGKEFAQETQILPLLEGYSTNEIIKTMTEE